MTWLVASSGRVGMRGGGGVVAAAGTSCGAAAPTLFALASVSHARYGTCALTYSPALGPSHAPACTVPSSEVSSLAAEAYSALSEVHAPAAAKSDPGPGPLLRSTECTSGGEAIHTGAVIVSGRPSMSPRQPRHRPRNSRQTHRHRLRRGRAPPRLQPPPQRVRCPGR